MPALDSPAGTIDVEVIPMRSVLSAVYLQLPNHNMTFIDFSLTNKGDRSETVMIESEILGYSERAISTVNVPSHGTVTVGQTPVLKPSFIPREMTTAPLDYRVTFRDGALIKESTEPIRVYAKDTMVWAVLEGGEWIDISEFIGAWVTPHDPSIDTLVRRAAEYHPSHTMEGYQCGDCSDEEWSEYTDLQVQALFEALKRDYHITYINTPIAFGLDTENPQRVRLPFDSISTDSANCIDGTVLYASALEALEMDPIIVITPTHAFLCYATQPDDDSDCNCLETTMTGSASFEEAANEGDQEYLEELKSGNFDSGESHIWSIRALRDGGVSPMQ